MDLSSDRKKQRLEELDRDKNFRRGYHLNHRTKINQFRTLRRKSEGCVNFSPYLAKQLTEIEKHYANLQERDQEEYEEELISSRNRSRIFKYLKNFQKEKFPPKIVHLFWNSVAQNSKEKAELFRTYFPSVFTDENYEQIDAAPLLEAGGQKIKFTEKAITKELEMLVVTKSRGTDVIPPILL